MIAKLRQRFAVSIDEAWPKNVAIPERGANYLEAICEGHQPKL
jgi:hypothetical protein